MAAPTRSFSDELNPFILQFAKKLQKGIEENTLFVSDVGFPDGNSLKFEKNIKVGKWRIEIGFLTTDQEISKVLVDFINSLGK